MIPSKLLRSPFPLPGQRVSFLLAASALSWASFSAVWMTCHSLRKSEFAVCTEISRWAGELTAASLGDEDLDDFSSEILGGIALPMLFSGAGAYVVLFLFRGDRGLSRAHSAARRGIGGGSSSDSGGAVATGRRHRLSKLRRAIAPAIQDAGKGDPWVGLWTHLLVTVPFLSATFHPLWDSWDDMRANGLAEVVGDLANPAGIGALVALSWFMVPAARQSPLLVAVGVNPVCALRMHIVAGRWCLLGSLLHTLCYIAIYINFNEDETKSWLAVTAHALFPPRSCWEASLPWNHGKEGEEGTGAMEGGHDQHGNRDLMDEMMLNDFGDFETEEDGNVIMPILDRGWAELHDRLLSRKDVLLCPIMMRNNEEVLSGDKRLLQHHGHGGHGGHGSGCYGYWRNFTGFVSVASLVMLVILSLNPIRRRHYKFFYVTHVILGCLMLLFAILHWRRSSSYLLPTLLYYLACTVPSVVQMAASLFRGGVAVRSSTFIAKSDGCAEVVLSRGRRAAQVEAAESGMYVRICVPEISLMWHPFTVASVAGDEENNLRLLFRKYGTFTTRLYRRLSMPDAPPPTVLVDAYYSGGTDWATRALDHDVVLMVAGGVGITPFLSMIPLLHSSLASSDALTENAPFLRRVELHWYTRDEGLARYVLGEHFSRLIASLDNVGASVVPGSDDGGDSGCKCRFDIVIHCTQRESDCEELLFTGLPVVGKVESVTDLESISVDSDSCMTVQTASLESGPEADDMEVSSPTLEGRNADVSRFNLSKKSSYDACVTMTAGLESDPDADLTVSYPTLKGHDVDISRFNVSGSHPYIRNLPGFIIFLATSLIGTRLIWRQEESPPERSAIMARANTTYYIFLISLLVGILAEIVWQLRSRCFTPSYEHINIEDENIDCDMSERTSLVLPHESSIGGGRVIIGIRVENGRPLVNNVVDGVTGAECPGVFLCGPHSLLSRIKEACRSGEKCWRPSSRVKFYEEHFEM